MYTCEWCKSGFVPKQKQKRTPRFCSRACVNAGQSGRGNPSFGKTYRSKETHPEWAAKVSSTSTERRINYGDKNGMKRADARARVSATRKALFAANPQMRKEIGRAVSAAWAAGKFDGVAVGRCKWYDHVRPDGSVVKLQGTWEVALARRLDELGVFYTAHEGRWAYTLDGVERFYYPDFRVPMWDATIDVKGALWGEHGSQKYDAVRAANYEKTLVIATRELLEEWGVDIVGTQRELLGDRVKVCD